MAAAGLPRQGRLLLVQSRPPVAFHPPLQQQLDRDRDRHADQQPHEAEVESAQREREQDPDRVQAHRSAYDPRADDRALEPLGHAVHDRDLEQRDADAIADQREDDGGNQRHHQPQIRHHPKHGHRHAQQERIREPHDQKPHPGDRADDHRGQHLPAQIAGQQPVR